MILSIVAFIGHWVAPSKVTRIHHRGIRRALSRDRGGANRVVGGALNPVWAEPQGGGFLNRGRGRGWGRTVLLLAADPARSCRPRRATAAEVSVVPPLPASWTWGTGHLRLLEVGGSSHGTRLRVSEVAALGSLRERLLKGPGSSSYLSWTPPPLPSSPSPQRPPSRELAASLGTAGQRGSSEQCAREPPAVGTRGTGFSLDQVALERE